LLCIEARVSSHRLRMGYLSHEEQDKIVEAGKRLSASKLFLDDTPGQNMLRIGATARRLKRRDGIRLVIVDYLQLIDPENRKEPRQEQVAAISRRLKHLARELKIPVIALAQLNRGVENRSDNRPRLADLRESGSIEQDADTVMMLHRSEDQEGAIEVIVGKQRNGPTGDVKLMFVRDLMKFENYATEDQRWA
jgi:replicative DNA helicase